MPGQSNEFWRMSIMMSSRLITGRSTRRASAKTGLLELRRAEIGDGEIEPPLRLLEGGPAMFDRVPTSLERGEDNRAIFGDAGD